MRSIRIIAVLVVITALTSPAHGATNHSKIPINRTDLPMLKPGSSLPYAPMSQFFSAVASHASAQQVADLQGQVLDTPKRLGGSALLALSNPGVPYEKHMYPAGDLTGTGANDLLVVQNNFPNDSGGIMNDVAGWGYETLNAVAGDTGKILWSKPVRDYYDRTLYMTIPGTPAGVPGSAHNDVVVIDIQDVGLMYEGGGFIQTLSVLDGRDGSTIWSIVIPSAAAEFEAFAGFINSVQVFPGAGSNGGPGLLVTTISGGGVLLQAGAFAFHETGFVVDALTGSTIATVNASALDASTGFLAGVPWISIGPSNSLLTISIASVATVLSSYALGASSPTWSQTLSLSDPTVPSVALQPFIASPNKIIVERIAADPFSPSTILDAVSSHDGAALWSKTVSGAPDDAGDVEGSGTRSIRMIAYSGYAWSGDATISTISAADGHTVWTKTIAPPPTPTNGWSAIEACMCAADLNGDGANETELLSTALDRNGDVAFLQAIALDGRDGSTLWSTPQLTSNLQFPAPAGVDFDGDGGQDLVAFDATGGPPQQIELTVSVESGIDLHPLWSNTKPESVLSGNYHVDLATLPVMLSSQALAVSWNEFAVVRNPDGTRGHAFDANVRMLSNGTELWNV